MTQNKISRRELLKLIGAGAASSLLAACQVQPVITQTTSDTTNTTSEVAPDETPLLRFAMYNFDPWLAALPKMFNDFEEEVGTAQVKLEAAPWEQFWSRFETQAAAGIAPDLQIGDPFKFAHYADAGLYLNVDPSVDADRVNLDDWLAASIAACRFEKTTGLVGQGALMGMPATLVGTILYYNKDRFDEAGVEYPNAEWTRLDYEEAALKLTRDNAGQSAADSDFDPENIAVYGTSHGGGYNEAVFAWNNGGGFVSEDQKECWFTKPETVEIYQWLADLLHQRHVTPDPSWFEGQPDVFLTERIAMKLDGSWSLDHYVENLTFNWDIAPVPLGTANLPRITYAGTNTLHIYSGTQFPQQAWDLLKFLAGPGGMKYFMKTGTPTLISAAMSDEYLTGQPEHRQVAIDIGDYGRTFYPHLGSDKWKEIYSQEIQALYLDRGTAEEVCATICEKISPILAEL